MHLRCIIFKTLAKISEKHFFRIDLFIILTQASFLNLLKWHSHLRQIILVNYSGFHRTEVTYELCQYVLRTMYYVRNQCICIYLCHCAELLLYSWKSNKIGTRFKRVLNSFKSVLKSFKSSCCKYIVNI